ncbi:MAG: outer membrane protein [Labilithrix sp.]|nr:outer membrane protein [Labilithrix sp.]
MNVLHRLAVSLAATATFVALAAGDARADDQLPAEELEDPKDRTEWAGFPVIGGSTDIGIQLGAAGAITHLGDRFKPYWWKVDALVSFSVKGGPRGTEVVQQSHDMRWDFPGGGGGKVRLMPGVFYDRTINSGYFGLGNASRVVTRPDGSIGDRYQFRHEEASTRLNMRSPIGGAYSTMYGWQLRYVNPHAYAESRLAIDAATRLDDGRPLIRGLQPLGIATLNAGVIYDTRSDEIYPRRGSFHLAAWRLSGATPTSSGVYWAGLNVILRRYADLPGGFVFAGRIIVDAMAGHVPFYDLSQGGAFDPNDMPGGAQGVRGVPNGRYSGLLKVVGNAEVRRIHFAVHVFGSKFQVGTTAFVDAGRVWNDYTFSDPRDGKSIGIKYGIGGGPFLIWDTAALFRIDVAYSPDASAANPGFPVGIYVQEGMMF